MKSAMINAVRAMAEDTVASVAMAEAAVSEVNDAVDRRGAIENHSTNLLSAVMAGAGMIAEAQGGTVGIGEISVAAMIAVHASRLHLWSRVSRR